MQKSLDFGTESSCARLYAYTELPGGKVSSASPWIKSTDVLSGRREIGLIP
jgi:hypothetical protein